ncbi:MAG: hypothetical protein M3O22_02170 [Pseudomonadota bacterium]|nr:hypothetical protein [Pseudomonadota bacterium]
MTEANFPHAAAPVGGLRPMYEYSLMGTGPDGFSLQVALRTPLPEILYENSLRKGWCCLIVFSVLAPGPESLPLLKLGFLANGNYEKWQVPGQLGTCPPDEIFVPPEQWHLVEARGRKEILGHFLREPGIATSAEALRVLMWHGLSMEWIEV